jgi:hypothetical protein
LPDSTVRFIGPDNAGRLEVSGATNGSLNGHVNDDATSVTGHVTGVFGQCNGHCPIEE